MSKNWTYSEGKALIDVYANRKEEYPKTKKKRRFWENILTDLEALNVLETPTTAENIQVKWRTARDRGTGTSTSKFMYLEDMEAIFHNDVGISSPHTATAGVETSTTAAPMEKTERLSESSTSSVSESNGTGKRKGRSQCKAMTEMKKAYYAEKLAARKENLQLKKEKLQVKKEKLKVLKEHITRTDAALLNILNKLH